MARLFTNIHETKIFEIAASWGNMIAIDYSKVWELWDIRFCIMKKYCGKLPKKMAPFRFGNSSSAEWVCDLTSSDYRAREGLFGPLIHMLGATLWALDCLFPSTGTVPLIRCNPNNQPHFGMIIRRCFRVYWVTWDHYDDQIRVTIPIEVGFEASPKSIVEWLSPLPKSVIAGKSHNAIPSLLAIASPSSWQKNAIRQEKISDKWHFYPFGGSLSLSLYVYMQSAAIPFFLVHLFQEIRVFRRSDVVGVSYVTRPLERVDNWNPNNCWVYGEKKTS